MERERILSWAAVGAAVAGFLLYVALGHGNIGPRATPPSGSPPSTIDTLAKDPLWTNLDFQVDAETTSREATYRFTVTNIGDRSITINSVGRSGPGLQLLDGKAEPRSVPPRGRSTISARFKVEDCRRIPSGAWPLPVAFTAKDQAAKTQYLDVAGTSPKTLWQSAATDAICHPQKVTLSLRPTVDTDNATARRIGARALAATLV